MTGKMFPIPLKEGLFIELESGADEQHTHYLSKILDVTRDHLHITYPRTLSVQQAPIGEDTAFHAGVITETGSYGFHTSVLRIESSPEPSLLISPPTEFYEWQRRYLRLDADLWVRYRTIPSLADAGVELPVRRIFTTTANIGGGGLLLRVEDDIPMGALLELEIDLPTVEEPVLALGRVVHGYGGRGIEFLLIDEPDRDTIIRYVFSAVRLSEAHDSSQAVHPQLIHEAAGGQR